MAVERSPFQVLPGGLAGGETEDISENIEIEIESPEGEVSPLVDENTLALLAGETDHYANLAELIDEDELESISNMAQEQYEADKSSREEWESTFERGFDLLGLKLQETTEPFEGACTAVSPMIIESAVKFQSKASTELFPASGPVRTQIVGDVNPEKELQANRVQNFMNYQLTDQITEYFDEFERMLFHLPLVGSAFKKVYYDPSLERPCSEFVPVDQFYVSYNAPDLRRADRYTHVIHRSPNDLKKETAAGLYRDVELPQAQPPDPTMLGQKIDRIMGVSPSADFDPQYVLLEHHCYLDLPEPFNSEDGVAYPYITTIEETSGKVLAIRRGWKQDDPRKERESWFAHYKFVPGFGFYGLGLIHLLGNLTMSATAALRNLVDAGQFANLPGGFKARGVRVVGGNDPISPGEFREVEATGIDLQKSIVPLPYKEPSQTLFQMLGFLTTAGQKFADTTDQVVADSTNYGPVGTTMALIEASAKFFSAVHKRLHHSQRDEFRILARINFEFLPNEYPYDLPNQQGNVLKQDFDGRIDIIPVSDPNVPSSAHRLAMAQMVLQLATQAPPGMYNIEQVHLSILNAANIQNPERFFAQQPNPQPNDPITDIQMASMGMPIKAFPEQDHKAHIAVKTSFIEDPSLGENKMMASVVPVLQANIREHMVMEYAEEMAGLVQMGAQQAEQQTGQVSPEVMSQLTINAAQQVLQANQGGSGSIQSLEQQTIQLEKANLELKHKGMQIEATKDAAELAIKNRDLDIKEMELRLDASEKVSNKMDRDVDRKLRALKDAGSLNQKEQDSVRAQNTKIVIESLRNMMRERELMLKEREAKAEGDYFDYAQGGPVRFALGSAVPGGPSRAVQAIMERLGIPREEAEMIVMSIQSGQIDPRQASPQEREIIASVQEEIVQERPMTPTGPVRRETPQEMGRRQVEEGQMAGREARVSGEERGRLAAERGRRRGEEIVETAIEQQQPQTVQQIYTEPKSEMSETEKEIRSAVDTLKQNPEEEAMTGPDIDSTAEEFIKTEEGFKDKKYSDVAGIETVGYGTAATSGRDIPDQVTEEQATAYLREDLGNASDVLENNVNVDLNKNQSAALKSLIYNVGPEAFKKSKALAALNAGNFDLAAVEFFDPDRGFTKAGGRKIQGLVNRRLRELDLWNRA